MSSAIYPTLPGLSFGVQRTVLPPPVQVRTTPSQREYRARDATVPRYQYALNYEFLRSSAARAELQTLVGFFNARGGSFEAFSFLDPDDNTVSAQQFGVGDGSTTSFQLLRSFGGFAEPVLDPIAPGEFFIAGQPANLLANASFETDTDANGLANSWQIYNTGTTGTVSFARVAGWNGAYAQQISASNLGTGSGDLADLLQPINGVSAWAGKKVSAFVAYKVSAACSLELFVEFYNASLVYLGSVTGGTVAASVSGAWQQLYLLAGTVPAGCDSARFVVKMSARSGSAGACSMTIDGAELVFGNVVQSIFTAPRPSLGADGMVTFSQAPAAGQALSWTGTFYRRVRFVRDQLELTKFMQDLWSGKVELISVKG